jgi:hypothetical protein
VCGDVAFWPSGVLGIPVSNMNFDSHERALLAALADVLIPAGDELPSASEAGVAGEGLDQVLSFRPDLATGLKNLLLKTRGCTAGPFIAELQQNDPAAFALLAEIVPGAYFLNRDVRARLGYEGQRAHPINALGEEIEAGLLRPVIDRGPIYRASPPQRKRD